MFEIDKNKFGEFVSGLRKEKCMTQRELAEKLFVSDKAVSKWETGQSLPDVTILTPLAESLGITVTELLECRRIAQNASMQPTEVETIVKKTISLSPKEGTRVKPTKKSVLIYAVCAIAAAAEIVLLLSIGITAGEITDSVFLFAFFGVFFGGYFFFFTREKLPSYYDENKISLYGDGILRMNIPGINFTNRNWPHIVKAGRFGTMTMLVGSPIFYLAGYYLFPSLRQTGAVAIAMALVFLSVLFVPIFVAGRKYK